MNLSFSSLNSTHTQNASTNLIACGKANLMTKEQINQIDIQSDLIELRKQNIAIDVNLVKDSIVITRVGILGGEYINENRSRVADPDGKEVVDTGVDNVISNQAVKLDSVGGLEEDEQSLLQRIQNKLNTNLNLVKSLMSGESNISVKDYTAPLVSQHYPLPTLIDINNMSVSRNRSC